MLIYEDEQDVINAVRAHCERKIIAMEKVIAKTTERSQDGLRSQGARSAYGDVLWLLTDYTLRIDEQMAASGD